LFSSVRPERSPKGAESNACPEQRRRGYEHFLYIFNKKINLINQCNHKRDENESGEMLKFAQVKSLGECAFRRLSGVKRKTFDVMVDILTTKENEKKNQGGRPNNLSMEDRLLMTLEYLREYRTYFHISKSYGLSESACYRNIRWIENTLIKSKVFSLPGRKELVKSDVEYEVILVDATESPIERPKKNKRIFIPEKRKDTRLKVS